jgi:predicted NUDIX family NTP pyrophosphohydrolase
MTDGQRSSKARSSAGVLAYRRGCHGLEVLLVHPGGPFWRNKDDGAWSIPKGELEAEEDPEQTSPPGIRRGTRLGGIRQTVAALGRDPAAWRQARGRLLRRR